MKTIGFIPRRSDLSRTAFREYYESQHAPLALRHIRVFTKYVRNHVVNSASVEPGFDCVSEFWFDDPGAVAEIGTWLSSPAGQVLRDDEAKFMDRTRIASCAVKERLLFGPARPAEQGIVRKLGFTLARAPVARPEDFALQVEIWCEELIRRNRASLLRAALDVPMDPLQANLPLHALVSVWPAAPGAAIEAPHGGAAIGSVAAVALEAIETPRAALGG